MAENLWRSALKLFFTGKTGPLQTILETGYYCGQFQPLYLLISVFKIYISGGKPSD